MTELRKALSSNRFVYFDGFERGIDSLYPRPVKALVGAEYERLRRRLREATEYRRIIFHGQLTDRYLSREELLSLAEDIRAWCEKLAAAADQEFGYDGFRRGSSFTKAVDTGLSERYRVKLTCIADYSS